MANFGEFPFQKLSDKSFRQLSEAAFGGTKGVEPVLTASLELLPELQNEALLELSDSFY